jgi:hypothetical protein
MAESNYKKLYGYIQAAIENLEDNPLFIHGTVSDFEIEFSRAARYPAIHLDLMTSTFIKTPDEYEYRVQFSVPFTILVDDSIREISEDKISKFDYACDLAERLYTNLLSNSQFVLDGNANLTPFKFKTTEQATGVIMNLTLELDGNLLCTDFVISPVTPSERRVVVAWGDIDGNILNQADLIAYIANNGGGGDFIPLAGTEVGSPVTGELEFSENTGLIFNNINFAKIISFGFEDEGITLETEDKSTNFAGSFTVSSSGILLSSNDPSSAGLSGGEDFSANITDLDYTQKIYVDNRFIYASPDTSGSTITLDCDSAHQAMFDLSTLTEDKTFVFSNVTNLKVFTCKVNCSGTRAFTFPSSVEKLISSESRFDNGTYVLTLDAGLYEFNISKWGSDYLIVVS